MSVVRTGIPAHGYAPDFRDPGFRVWRAYPWHQDHDIQRQAPRPQPLQAKEVATPAACAILRCMDGRERIKELAREHGFPLVGIAAVPADGAAPGAGIFQDWLARGLHGPLDYMAQSAPQRTNLHERFPWARSVLCVGLFYDGREAEAMRAGSPQSVNDALLTHVARYARGRDYHLVFEKRMKALARAMIAARHCGRAHWYVNTGPVLERAWAASAGLGWIGKNTCLIHPVHGSYFLLGEIILDAELAPDALLPDRCGTCRRCLDACPTGALRAPRELDAARCISTWTLEMKGELPSADAVPLHGWVAGCDACQTVCPFNASQRATAGDPDLTTADWQGLALAQAILLRQDEYDCLFKASALRRVGWKGLRLNAMRAAAQSTEPAIREALRACQDDPDSEIRGEARKVLDAHAGTSRP